MEKCQNHIPPRGLNTPRSQSPHNGVQIQTDAKMPEPIQEGQRSTVATNQNIENVQINLDCKVPWIIGPKKQETYLKDQGTYLLNYPKGLNWQNGQKPKVLQTVIAQRIKSKMWGSPLQLQGYHHLPLKGNTLFYISYLRPKTLFMVQNFR